MLEDCNLAVGCGVLNEITSEDVSTHKNRTYIFFRLPNHNVLVLITLGGADELPNEGGGPIDGRDLWFLNFLLGGFWSHIRYGY